MNALHETVTPGRLRVPWVDTVRVVLIAGMIVLHVATGYVVDIAGWYYDDERDATGATSAVLTVVGAVGGLFWLGPFFFVAGWFSVRSLAHRGPGGFARARLLRLGLPLLAFVLLLQPFTDWLGNLRDERGSFVYYLRQTEVGAMWFVAALLAFSLVYALVRRIRPAPPARHPEGAGALALSMAVIAVGSFAVWQLWFVTDEMLLNLKLAEWPQGAVLFALGVLSAEARWVGTPHDLRGERRLGWLALGGALALVGLLAIGVSSGARDLGPATGWPTIATAGLDGFVAVTWTLWFVAWSSRRWGEHGTLVAVAARSSYATYFIHATVVTAIMLALSPVDLGVWSKFFLVSVVGVPASFAAGYGLTRVPGVSSVL